MERRGVVQWAVGSLDDTRIHAEVGRAEWHALDAGGPTGPGAFEAAVRLVDADPLFWGEHERAADPALYAHGLMTDPAASGGGLGALVRRPNVGPDDCCAWTARRISSPTTCRSASPRWARRTSRPSAPSCWSAPPARSEPVDVAGLPGTVEHRCLCLCLCLCRDAPEMA